MPHLHFIVNPVAGGGGCLRRFRRAVEVLEERGIDYTAVYSEYPGHASELTRIAPECDCIVAVGGDGTVREVARELIHTSMPMGILPFGTGNDLIKSLGIPGDAVGALELLLEGSACSIDAVDAGGDIYFNVAGFGFDVDVLERTRYYKNRFRGRVAYILGVIHALFHLRIHSVQVNGGPQPLKADVLLVAVGNGCCIGGGMQVTPLADPSDGLLDICVVTKVGPLGVLRFLLRFIRGKHLDMDIVHYFRTDRLEVLSEDCLLVQMDGEIVGKTPLSFQILPGALHIIATAQKDREHIAGSGRMSANI